MKKTKFLVYLLLILSVTLVDINSQEFKEALELSSMTREQIEQKMEELVKQNEKLENTKEIEYNPEIHDDGEDGSNS